MSEETIIPPEIVRSNYKHLALQGRLLLAGTKGRTYLSPNKIDITREEVTADNLQKPDYDIVSSASLIERTKTALVEKDALPDAINTWATRCSSSLHQDFSTKKGFDAEKTQRWKKTLTTITGKDITSSSPDDTKTLMKSLYVKYFGVDGRVSDIEQFTKDILASFDLPSLEENLDCIEWFGTMFGSTSSEIVSSLTRAISKTKEQPEEFIKQLKAENRINTISTDRPSPDKHSEKELLEFLFEPDNEVTSQPANQVITTTTTTVPPPAPPRTSTPTRPATESQVVEATVKPVKDESIVQITEKDLEQIPEVKDTDGMAIYKASIESNKNLAQHFIEKLDELKAGAKAKGYLPSFLTNSLGFTFINTNEHYSINDAVLNSMERYGMPIMIYGRDGHARLVLKIYNIDDQWKMIYWDPYSSGNKQKNVEDAPIKIAILDDKENTAYQPQFTLDQLWQLLTNNDIIISQPADLKPFYRNGQLDYDLTLEGDRDLTDAQVAAKIGSLQPASDVKNCVMYCVFNGMLRTAAKYLRNNHPVHLDKFFTQGLQKFHEDFGFPIATRDELIAQT